MARRRRRVCMSVDESFFNKLEKERQVFMKTNGLTRLTLTQFTEFKAKNDLNMFKKNGKKRKRS